MIDLKHASKALLFSGVVCLLIIALVSVSGVFGWIFSILGWFLFALLGLFILNRIR